MKTLGRLLLLFFCLPGTGQAAARFALVTGSDLGAASRPRLWFAESDAERFGATLRELGDFAPERVTVLRTPTAAQFRQALESMEAQIQKARDTGERPLLVVYFSGHAGPGGLELGNERIGFDELRSRVTRSAAETRVAIVDACEAGLLTQVKGATAAPALDFPIPADEQVQGTAFVTSTAVGEAAQESASIGGSFFTHHLEIALRGAGDADGDGRITLAEAFRYTAARTLAGTVATRSGPQHATYEFKMSGRGDVILADLRLADARLVLPPDPRAQYLLQGPGNTISEVSGSGSRLVLAVPAGRYTVERRAPEGRATTDLTLERGKEQVLPSLTPTRYELARAKGGPKPTLLYAGGGALAVGLSNGGVAPAALIGARQEWGPVGIRITLAFGAKSVDDQGLIYDYKNFSGSLAALFPLNTSAVLVEAGPMAGYGYVTQTLADRRSFSSGAFSFGLAVLVSAPVGPIRLGLDASAGAQVVTLNNGTSVLPAGSLSVVVLQGF